MPTDREKSRASAPISVGVPRRILKARKKRDLHKRIKQVRADVLLRAAGCCEVCGNFCLDTGECHHKNLRSRGGEWSMANILFLCRTCHGKQHGVRR